MSYETGYERSGEPVELNDDWMNDVYPFYQFKNKIGKIHRLNSRWVEVDFCGERISLYVEQVRFLKKHQKHLF